MTATYSFPTHDLVSSYVVAKREVIRAGYIDEIVWQHQARLVDVDQVTFMREAAWVVLCVGMREQVVRRRFGPLGKVLHDWDPYKIAGDDETVDRALRLFGHHGKISAIRAIATTVASLPTHELRRLLQEDCRGFLLELPYVGPVTWAHLAKNLGVQVAKADRHLVRLSHAYGRPSVPDLCSEISSWLDEPVPVVDLVLWRYSVLHAEFCPSRPCDGLPHRFIDGTDSADRKRCTPRTSRGVDRRRWWWNDMA